MPRDMPVFQGDNLEVSLSPLPMRGGEGVGEQGVGHLVRSGKIWGRNVETQLRVCIY